MRLPKSVLRAKQRDLGSAAYAGQYQQRPAPLTGNVVNPDWYLWHDADKVPLLDATYLSIDTATKKSDASCDWSLQAWGTAGITNYLLDKITKKMNYTEGKANIRSLSAIVAERYGWKPVLILEAKSSGDQVYDELKSEFSIIRVDPTTEKMQRLSTCSPLIEAHQVSLPSNATGIDIQTKTAKAPHCAKDDVDALSQFLNWRRTHDGSLAGWKAYAELMRTGRYADGSPVGGPPPIKAESPGSSIADLHRAANEAAGLSPRPATFTPREPQANQRGKVAACPTCGNINLFESSRGQKCMACGWLREFPGSL